MITILVKISLVNKFTDTFLVSKTGIITGLNIVYIERSDVISIIVNIGFTDARCCSRERCRIADEDKIREQLFGLISEAHLLLSSEYILYGHSCRHGS